jgi:hypothetical protein
MPGPDSFVVESVVRIGEIILRVSVGCFSSQCFDDVIESKVSLFIQLRCAGYGGFRTQSFRGIGSALEWTELGMG